MKNPDEEDLPRSPGKLAQLVAIWRQMGPRYVAFRALWEVKRRTGLLERSFPTKPPRHDFISLAAWRKDAPAFFFESRETVNVAKDPSERLQAEAERVLRGEVKMFSAYWQDMGEDWDWHTHPETAYKYPNAHWTRIADFSRASGDIKLVWEKARFSHLYTVIRYDHHFGEDHAEWVFAGMEDFIAKNPINKGPQYRCSQEMSLRVLNWTFALYFYRNSEALTEARFGRIMHAIRWHLHHIRKAIHFSRIAVRNNHAITETLCLYLSGLLFPFIPETEEYKRKGRAWLKEELLYQIYEDGTYLQFSMNYHRVVVQLLSWAIRLAEIHKEPFGEEITQRAKASLHFLDSCQDSISGWLPNYGANDGALFFPLSQSHYRDYRPQLAALDRVMGGKGESEEAGWLLNIEFGIKNEELKSNQNSMEVSSSSIVEAEAGYPGGNSAFNSETEVIDTPILNSPFSILHFPKGGYASAKNHRSLIFLRCGSHKDRPSQADNLHVDIWWRGRNLLRDAGSYKYNTDPETLMKFVGTPAHNTCTLGRHNQMQKGSRFIWYHWSQALELETDDTDEWAALNGGIQAFGQLAGNGVTHHRTVRIHLEKPIWEVADEFTDTLGHDLVQHWHPAPGYEGKLIFEAVDGDGRTLEPEVGEGFYSSFYGKKEEVPHLCFRTSGSRIRTLITVKDDDMPVPRYPDMPLDEK